MKRPNRWTSLAVFCALILLIGSCSKNEKSNSEKRETDFMTINELEQKVLAKDWEALNIVDSMEAPETAIAPLEKLVKHDDVEVRELALNCVTMISDPRVPPILVEALSDSDPDNRIFALSSLEGSDAGSVAAGLLANLGHEDGAVRSGVALLLGYTTVGEAGEKLKQRLAVEKDADAERSIKLALAKLGDGEMKDFFASQMDVPDSAVRLRTLADFRYIDDAGMSFRILPALDDTGQAHLISSKSKTEVKFNRVCDAAINLIDELNDHPFTFEVDEYKIYGDEEIAEAKKFLGGLKAE